MGALRSERISRDPEMGRAWRILLCPGNLLSLTKQQRRPANSKRDRMALSNGKHTCDERPGDNLGTTFTCRGFHRGPSTGPSIEFSENGAPGLRYRALNDAKANGKPDAS